MFTELNSNFPDLDVILFVLVILLFLSIVVAAFWPPHRHNYDRLIAKNTDFQSHHWFCWQCACGKQYSEYRPLTPAAEDDF